MIDRTEQVVGSNLVELPDVRRLVDDDGADRDIGEIGALVVGRAASADSTGCCGRQPGPTGHSGVEDLRWLLHLALSVRYRRPWPAKPDRGCGGIRERRHRPRTQTV
jgi:hypothetical protein